MPPFSNTNSRWTAVQSRNPLAANAFIYSVTTTKIYCRPTCPSRLARRANIIFHDTPQQAAADGFRACKRCRPEVKDDETDPQRIFVEKACDLIGKENEDGMKWGVKALAQEVGVTESHFCRVFKKIMGITIGEYRSRIHTTKEAFMPDDTRKESDTSKTSMSILGSRTLPEPDQMVGHQEVSFLPDIMDISRGWEPSYIDFSILESTYDAEILRFDFTAFETDPPSLEFEAHSFDDGDQFINYELTT